MKVKYIPIFVLVGLLAILSGMPALSTGITNYAYAKYATNTQTQANANECETGTNCVINSPQTQGDGTANSPTNLQISKFNEEQVEEPPVGAFLVSLDSCIRLVSPFPDGYRCTVVSPETLRGNASCLTALSICTFSADGSVFRCDPFPVLVPISLTVRCGI
jgi:hypothetical protein